MHPFRKFISEYSHLSDDEWNQVEPHLSKMNVKHGEFILREGQVCRKLYFLDKGFLKYFVLKDNGEESTKFFTIAPYCFTSQVSLNKEIPARENIQALSESMIWQLDKSMTFDLLRIPAWSEFIRKLVQEVQHFTEEIVLELQNKTAEERYLEMVGNESQIIKNASLKEIASYLGIAPQSLSRIRKKHKNSRAT